MDGYGQYVPLDSYTNSPGDDFDALEKDVQRQYKETSKHMRRKLIFDDNPEGHSGENSKKKKKKSFCNEVTGVGCTIQGGRRSRKKRRKKRSRKTRRRRGSGFCLTKECRRKRKEKKRQKRETKKFNKIREDADELLYSLAYDVCPLTTKAEYDECVDNIVNRNKDHYMEADEMLRELKKSGKMRSASEPSVSSGPIAPPPGMKRKSKIKRHSDPIVGDGNLIINPLHQKGGRKRRRTRRKSKRRLRRRQRKSKKRRKR